jgi:hypothetical protein
MTAECAITRVGHVAGFNETSGRAVLPTPATIYAGPARLQASQRLSGTADIGGKQVVQHRYMVAIPADSPVPQVNDQVTVTACTGDPDFVGRILRIVDVLDGSLLWQRDFVAEDVEPATR